MIALVCQYMDVGNQWWGGAREIVLAHVKVGKT